MQAERAFNKSDGCMIVADTQRGLVTIYHEAAAELRSANSYYVCFIQRETGGKLYPACTVTVGSYEDLDTALTIAAISYGVCEAGWMPASDEELGRAPPVEFNARH